MKYLETSDIHLGHIRTPTEHIIKSLVKYILSKENEDLDVIFIPGDMFDRLLELNSIQVKQILGFFNKLIEYCYTNNIMLRVMEGTPSHDWQQMAILEKMNDMHPNKCDFKYIRVLDIEYIEKFDKYVLYIPDEWSNSHEDVEKQIAEKMLAHGISQVDIAMLHGQFFYQLPIANYKGFYYKEEYFLKIVKGYIHVGHYHTFSTFDRIIASGSLERLTHGEEEPKGYVRVDGDNWKFVENKDAYIYKTLNVTNSTTYASLDKRILELPKESHIRLLMSKDHPFNLTFNDLKSRYLDYNLRKLIKEHTAETNTLTYIATDTTLYGSDGYVLERNIHEVLLETIIAKHQLTNQELDKVRDYIKPLMEVDNESTIS